MNMHPQLGGGSPQGREGRHDGDLPGLQIEPGTAVDVSKGKFDEIAGKIGGNIFQALYNPFAGLAVDFLQFLPSSFITLAIHRAFSSKGTVSLMHGGAANLHQEKVRDRVLRRSAPSKPGHSGPGCWR